MQRNRHTVLWMALLGLGLASLASAQQLYRIVGPDGKVTYSDRPATGASAKGAKSQAVKSDRESRALANLPYSLRTVAEKYPVTVFTGRDCEPCDAGRTFLQQRGIPYTEKTIENVDDQKALINLTNSKNLPQLQVGTKFLRGFGLDDWSQYLDAAGYPKESVLPANYKQAAAATLTKPKPTPTPAPEVTPAPSAPAVTDIPVANPNRF